jgi:hypothetical protein
MPRIVGIALVAVAAAMAADRPVYLGYVFPAGGRPGTTVEMTCAGESLAGVTAVIALGGGVTGRVLDAGQEPGDERKIKKKGQTVLDETVRIALDIAADAAPGERHIALLTPRGITNLRCVLIDPLPVVREREPNDRPTQAQAIVLPAMVDGQLTAGDADTFSFTAAAGQRVVARLAARRLIPYIADAVPGWCQGVLVLSGPDGRELVTAEGGAGNHGDPLLTAVIPSAGTWKLTVRDAIWRGRADFVYRLAVGDLPATTAAADAAPAATLAESADSRTGQAIALPAVVAGTLATAGEEDRFVVAGRAGQTLSLAVWAQRIGSPIDARVTVTGPDGVRLADADDSTDRADGLRTFHADPALTCTLRQDGPHVVRLFCVQDRTGPYRLRIAEAHSQATVIATPAAVTAPPGGSAVLTLHVLRREGFSGPLRIACDGPLRVDGGLVPAGVDQLRLTLTAPPEAGGVVLPALRAVADDGSTQAVGAAEDQMQAFLWRSLVPLPASVVAVQGDPVCAIRVDAGPDRLELPVGRETTVGVRVRRVPGRDGPIQIQLSDPPEGIVLRRGSIPAGAERGQMTIRVNATVKPGVAGNLIAVGSLLLDAPVTEGPATAAAVSAGSATASGPATAAKPPPRPRQRIQMPAVAFRTVAQAKNATEKL